MHGELFGLAQLSIRNEQISAISCRHHRLRSSSSIEHFYIFFVVSATFTSPFSIIITTFIYLIATTHLESIVRYSVARIET
jgi:hypothetical protein